MNEKNHFSDLTSRSLAGSAPSRAEALDLLQTPEKHLPALLWAAFRVRRKFWGTKVKLCVLRNARSGLCPEDCHYCSQSAVSSAEIEKYGLLSRRELVAGARRAVSAGARRYCMVTSGRGPGKKDLKHLSTAVEEIKREFPALEICLSLGLMSEQQAGQLKKAGVGWINHNLNTSRRFYPEICSTHTYDDRIRTVENVKRAGLSTCSGGIVGMGESSADFVKLAFTLRELEVDSIPVNFLHPVKGTPLENRTRFDPIRGLKALCLMRLLNPSSEIRMAAGRELYLGPAAGLALYPANSMFVEGYLTTSGQAAGDARKLVVEAGFEIEGSVSNGQDPLKDSPRYPSLLPFREWNHGREAQDRA